MLCVEAVKSADSAANPTPGLCNEGSKFFNFGNRWQFFADFFQGILGSEGRLKDNAIGFAQQGDHGLVETPPLETFEV